MVMLLLGFFLWTSQAWRADFNAASSVPFSVEALCVAAIGTLCWLMISSWIILANKLYNILGILVILYREIPINQ